jgi:ribosome-associated protein
LREAKLREVTYDNSTGLNSYIVELIQDKKGKSIVSLDLREIPEAISDYFIVCHGDSTTQVKAIVDNVYRKLKENRGEIPHHIEGMQSAEWAIVDYVDVVLHVFLREKREYYQLEDLWSDAAATGYDDLI